NGAGEVAPGHAVERVGAFTDEDLLERKGRQRSDQRLDDHASNGPEQEALPDPASDAVAAGNQREAGDGGGQRRQQEGRRAQRLKIPVDPTAVSRANDEGFARDVDRDDDRCHKSDDECVRERCRPVEVHRPGNPTPRRFARQTLQCRLSMPTVRQQALIAILFAGLTVALTFPQAVRLDSVPYHSDPYFSMWRLGWVA